MTILSQGGLRLSKRDLKVFKVIEKFRYGTYSREQAALKLNVSLRTVTRKAKAIRKLGIEGLVHGNRGKPSKARKTPETRAWFIEIYKTRYYDFNVQHAFETIFERHNPPETISYDTFRRWLIEEGVNQAKRRRSSKARLHRERHANEGLMVQFDGSPHRYNGKDQWTLIHAIDDATGKILGAEFQPSETTYGCMKVMSNLIEDYGIPEFILTDCAGWSAKTGKRAQFSQFERACNELDIDIIATPNPQSKGPVERSFRTVQGRLVPELRLVGITNIQMANHYLQQVFVPRYNQRFSVKPASSTTRFRPLPTYIKLRDIFCMKHQRMVNRDHTVNFDGKRYKLTAPPKNLWKHEVTILVYHTGEMKIHLGDEPLEFAEIKVHKRRWQRGA